MRMIFTLIGMGVLVVFAGWRGMGTVDVCLMFLVWVIMDLVTIRNKLDQISKK